MVFSLIKITYNTNFVCSLLGHLSWCLLGQRAFYNINRYLLGYFDSFRSVLIEFFDNFKLPRVGPFICGSFIGPVNNLMHIGC